MPAPARATPGDQRRRRELPRAPRLTSTAGKRESGAPANTWARVEGHVSLFDIAATVKRTGRRYINDQNLPVFIGTTKIAEANAPPIPRST
jgi:iron complex outermembrane receptor protein